MGTGRWVRGWLLALVLAVSGCAPTLTYQSDTTVALSGEVRRQTRLHIQPDASMPGLRTRLTDYATLPQAREYAQFDAVSNQVQMIGLFGGFDEIPADLRLKPPAGGKETTNKAYQRGFDVVLFRIVDYEERYDDGVDFYEGEAALDLFWTWVVPEAEALLAAGWGRDYDVSGFGTWLRGDGRQLAKRLYELVWEIRRARRGGIAGEGEEAELRRRIGLEMRRYGVEVVDAGVPDADRINQERIEHWFDQRMAEWFRPRQAGTPPVRMSSFRSGAERARLQAAAVEAVKTRYGSLDSAIERVRPWAPRMFGTFILPDIVPVPTLARTRMSVRWRLPGWVLHTNGYRDFDGSLRWDFNSRDVALSGYTVWARMVTPDPEAMRALDLRGFPDRLTTMERYVSLLFREDRRTTRSAVVAALRHSVRSSNLLPLESLSAGNEGVASGDVEAAKALAELLSRFRHKKPDDGDAVDPIMTMPAPSEESDWR